MNWHTSNEFPSKDRTLYLVEIVENIDIGGGSVVNTYYEVMWYHSCNHYFSKQSDPKGVYGLKQECVLRWTEID